MMAIVSWTNEEPTSQHPDHVFRRIGQNSDMATAGLWHDSTASCAGNIGRRTEPSDGAPSETRIRRAGTPFGSAALLAGHGVEATVC